MNTEVIMAYLSGLRLRFARDTRGVTAIEYGLIAALIACFIIVAVSQVGVQLQNFFYYLAYAVLAQSWANY